MFIQISDIQNAYKSKKNANIAYFLMRPLNTKFSFFFIVFDEEHKGNKGKREVI